MSEPMPQASVSNTMEVLCSFSAMFFQDGSHLLKIYNPSKQV